MKESQLAVPGTVLVSSGKQTLERTHDGKLVVTDGWLTDWVVVYTHKPKWAHDGTLAINKKLRERLDQIAIEEVEYRPTMTHEQFVMDIAERECHSDTMVPPGPMEKQLRDQIAAHMHWLEMNGDHETLDSFKNLPIEPYPCGW